MKKTLLIALTVIGASLATAKADVAFSVSFGNYHYTPRRCYTPQPVYCPPPQVYYSAPVYTAPVYAAPVYTAPVYAPVAPVCPPPVVVGVGGYYGRGGGIGCDQPKYGYGRSYGGHGYSHGYNRGHGYQAGFGYKH
jgi:hypothetical protein